MKIGDAGELGMEFVKNGASIYIQGIPNPDDNRVDARLHVGPVQLNSRQVWEAMLEPAQRYDCQIRYEENRVVYE